MNTKKILRLTTTLTIALLTGCGTTKEQPQPESTPAETAVEQTDATKEATQTLEDTETTESTTEEPATEPVEEVTEDPTADLTKEEWVDSLNVKRPTFLVFNSITGKRKALEDGAEYTLVEGDELGLIMPSRWLLVDENIMIYNTIENKYGCVVFELDFYMISQNTEFTRTYNNLDGEPITVTVYLSQ